MKIELWAVLWAIFTISIIYWDINRWENENPLSQCHHAEIMMYHSKPMCTECKLFCEVINGQKKIKGK